MRKSNRQSKKGASKGSAKPRTKKAAIGGRIQTKQATEGIRLQLILARAGIASRRAAEGLIRQGEVKVNGRVVTELGSKARPGVDHIKVGGRLLRGSARLEYFLYNKPVACVSTMSDPEGRFCIGDVVRRLRRPLFPVGRLDYASCGLVLLTNDGELAERLLHARYRIERTYMVKLSRCPTYAVLERLRRGIRLRDGTAKALHARIVRRVGDKAWVEIVIDEGRSRQVRRMFEACGILIEKLRRTRMGSLKLGRLAMGDLRRLETGELEALRGLAGLPCRTARS